MSAMKRLFQVMADKKASDIFISVGAPINIKINGVSVPVNQTVLNSDAVRQLLYEILNEKQIRTYEDELELNTGYIYENVGNYRISAFQQKGSPAVVIRYIPSNIPQIDTLDLPETLKDIIMQKRGLVLVVGALPFALLSLAIGFQVGSGTAAAVLNAVLIPSAVVSGLWMPLSMMPAFFADIARFLPTYHPGTASVEDARTVRVGVSQEVTADFSMVPGRMVRISGTASRSNGLPAAGSNVFLEVRTSNSSGRVDGGAVAADGSFTIGNLAPGDYVLQVGPPRGAAGPDADHFGTHRPSLCVQTPSRPGRPGPGRQCWVP